MNLIYLVAPTTPLVGAEELMEHLRVSDPQESTAVERLGKAAQSLAERRLDRALTSQQWRLVLDAFPSVIKLPRAPLLTIDEFTYVDSAGVTQTLASSAYRLDSDAEPARITPAYGTSWPATLPVTGAVRIKYTCGHDANRPAPEVAAQAIKLLVAHWYENPEAVVTGTISTQVELAFEALIASARVVAEYDQ